MDPVTVGRDDQMECLCVLHKLKVITVIALVLSVFGVLSFALSIWFFHARSALIELDNLTSQILA